VFGLEPQTLAKNTQDAKQFKQSDRSDDDKQRFPQAALLHIEEIVRNFLLQGLQRCQKEAAEFLQRFLR